MMICPLLYDLTSSNISIFWYFCCNHLLLGSKVKQKAIAFLLVYNLWYSKQEEIEQTRGYSIFFYIYIYFNGLSSLRNTAAKALSWFVKRRSHSAIRVGWVLEYTPERLLFRKIKISKFIIDETQLKVGSELIWLCGVAIETTKDKEILSITISKERKIYVVVAERFLSNLLKEYDKHPILTSDGRT